MNAIRQKIKRTGNKVIIELPEDFKAETFELILFPIEGNSESGSAEADKINEWRKFSIRNIDRIYNEEEADYSNILVKEPNEKYSP
jgi:hypothetical protein